MNPAPSDNAGVIVRPPLLYLGSILLGVALQLVWPLAVFPRALERPLGSALVGLALLLFAWAIREFQRADTPIPTNLPSRAIVQRGPYARSRNPIYLSFTLLHLGLALWVNSLWLLATLLATTAVLSFGVIAREERYLERRFGDEYRDYRARVRRWL